MAGLVALAACSRPGGEGCDEAKPIATNQSKVAAVRSMLKRMPKIIVKDDKTGKFLRIGNDGFNFSSPGDGWSFSSPSGYQYVAGSNGSSGTIFISSSAFGTNAAGPSSSGGSGGSGVVVAGPTSLNINYTFCYSADAEAMGLDLFDVGDGPDIDGVSGVLGVSGDFAALQDTNNVDEDEIKNIFHGLASYVVYDNQASGAYEIVNWLSAGDDELEADDLANKGFAFVIDFQNARIYFSERGRLNVSGGTITYSGSYLMAEISEDNEEMQVTSVSGVGAMGCN